MPTIGVFQIPAPGELLWRQAIYQAANAKGWQTFEGSCGLSSDPQSDRLMVTSDPADVDQTYVDHWVVLRADGGRSVVYLSDALMVGDSGVAMIASRLAAADVLARRGASVFGEDATAIVIPALGTVDLLSPVPHVNAGASRLEKSARVALAMYDALPVPLGATGVWPSSFFKESGTETYGLGRIDLTGRARTIIQGPYISLPPGRWRIIADFEIATPRDGGRFIFAWGADNHMTEWSGHLPHSGGYQVQLETTWPEIAPAQFNVAVLHPVFSGSIEMLKVRVEKVG